MSPNRDPLLLLVLGLGGLGSGLLAGLLGIGGGMILVPLQVALGFPPVTAIATSSLAITLTSLSGSIQNFRMGVLRLKQVTLIGIPAIVTAQAGSWLANQFSSFLLLTLFGCLVLLNIFLVSWKVKVSHQNINIADQNSSLPNWLSRTLTGGFAGILAGLFGVGGGVIMVPMQMILLQEPIKPAIQTSLGVIVITGISACIGHALRGNVSFLVGAILGLGGLLGAQLSTRLLPTLSNQMVAWIFSSTSILVAGYIFSQAWEAYRLSQS
jgi:uncharacterized membrane protein YfcA